MSFLSLRRFCFSERVLQPLGIVVGDRIDRPDRFLGVREALGASFPGLPCVQGGRGATKNRSVDLLVLPDHDHAVRGDGESFPVTVEVEPDPSAGRDPYVLVEDGAPNLGPFADVDPIE